MSQPLDKSHIYAAIIIGTCTIAAATITAGWYSGWWAAPKTSNNNLVANEKVEESNNKSASSIPGAQGANNPTGNKPNSEVELNRQIFNLSSPYPIGLENIRIGALLSELNKSYPKGRITSSWTLDLDDSIFSRVNVNFDKQAYDPKVRHIAYSYRNDEAMQEVRKQALATFKSKNCSVKFLGSSITCSNINGLQLEINPYRLLVYKQ